MKWDLFSRTVLRELPSLRREDVHAEVFRSTNYVVFSHLHGLAVARLRNADGLRLMREAELTRARAEEDALGDQQEEEGNAGSPSDPGQLHPDDYFWGGRLRRKQRPRGLAIAIEHARLSAMDDMQALLLMAYEDHAT